MRRFFIPVLILTMMAGCSSKQNKESIPAEKVIHVTTDKVKMEKVAAGLRYSGTVEAFQTIPLSFKTTGTVERVLVDAGDKVTKGQLLATIDATDSKNLYQITLSKYQQAKDAYDRLKTVYDNGSLTEVKWVEMETNLEQAQSSLEISKNNLDKCNMRSPVTGVVGRRNIEPGMSSLSIGAAPLEIVDIRMVYVKISVPENEVTKIANGMTAGFKVSALDDERFEGIISNVSPVADKISRTYEAKIKADNPAMKLKPGMVCDVEMKENIEKDMIVIPYQSVFRDNDNKSYVFVVDTIQKRVKKQLISVGQYLDSDLEVLSGLSEGQLIVTEGKEKLSDNSLIAL
jgi:membrane fusion protein, multidrug efflux system